MNRTVINHRQFWFRSQIIFGIGIEKDPFQCTDLGLQAILIQYKRQIRTDCHKAVSRQHHRQHHHMIEGQEQEQIPHEGKSRGCQHIHIYRTLRCRDDSSQNHPGQVGHKINHNTIYVNHGKPSVL